MPPGDYDLAGFAVGAVERGKLLPRRDIAAGDVVLGLKSSGLHANGFSLVRAVVERCGLDYAAAAPFSPERSLGEALLAPTRIYVAACLAAHAGGALKALAHITGGGLPGNIPRVLPPGLGCEIDAGRWPLAAGIPVVGGGGRRNSRGTRPHVQLRHRHGSGGRRPTAPPRSHARSSIAASRSLRSAASFHMRATVPAST